ncbi:MAG: hypothetical protein ACR2HJ_11635 [Fimbriimonadales bacterium]
MAGFLNLSRSVKPNLPRLGMLLRKTASSAFVKRALLDLTMHIWLLRVWERMGFERAKVGCWYL